MGSVHNKPYIADNEELTSKSKNVKCNVCQEKFRTLDALHQHMIIHKSEAIHCRFCERAFPTQTDLSVLVLRSHSEIQEFPCEVCSKIYSSQMRLQDHQYRMHEKRSKRAGKKLLCDICSACFNHRNPYMIHMRKHQKKYVAKCDECGVGFFTNISYERHRINKHGLKKYVCHVCGKSLSSAYMLKLHIGRHATPEEREKAGFKCFDCDKMFVTARLLKEHQINKHMKKGEKLFICYICGQKLNSSHSLRNHSKVHERRNKDIYCSFCGDIFLYEKSLKRHLAEKHPETVPFKCNKCGKGCISMLALRVHLASVHKFDGERNEDDPLACIVCNDKFSTTDLLLQHQIQRHTVIIRGKRTDYQKLKCNICFRIFSNFDNLSKHSSSHENTNEHLCDLCQNTFKSSDDLKLHYQEHTREKQFCCIYCSKCFASSEILLPHERTHTGEKPFICPFCGKAFRQRHVMVTHKRTHTGEKPFACSFCGKGFRQRAPMITHERTHTEERPFDCQFCDKSFKSGHNLNVHLKKCSK